MSGKGSAPRPYSVPMETFDQSFERIFGITCSNCDHSVLYAGNGHCYMFKDKPLRVCGQFKEIEDGGESEPSADMR